MRLAGEWMVALFLATSPGVSATSDTSDASSVIDGGNDSVAFGKGYEVTIALAGQDTLDVWSSVDTWNKCKIIDVSDIPLRVFRDVPSNLTRMIDGSTNYHLMSGPSLRQILNDGTSINAWERRECGVAWNMTGNPDPAMFAANEFLDSSIAFPNGTVATLIHTEFPGDRYNACEEPLGYPHCWTVTLGLALSKDGGRTFQHARPPPHHLVAAVPYPYDQSHLAYGWGAPSNIILGRHDHDDGSAWYYVTMANRNQVGLQAPGTCLARTKNLMDPTSWRGWNGETFNVTLSQSPYGKIFNNVSDHICQTLDLPIPAGSPCGIFGLAWSVYLEEYVATIACREEGSNKHLSDFFYFAKSPDLVHWDSTMKPFFSRKDIPEYISKQTTAFAYPNFLDPDAPHLYDDINYNTIGQSPYLFWTSLGHNVYQDGRHLWATPVTFEKRNTTTTKQQ